MKFSYSKYKSNLSSMETAGYALLILCATSAVNIIMPYIMKIPGVSWVISFLEWDARLIPSLSTTQYAVEYGAIIDKYVVGIIVAIVIISLFLLCYWQVYKNRKVGFIMGIILYGVDTLIDVYVFVLSFSEIQFSFSVVFYLILDVIARIVAFGFMFDGVFAQRQNEKMLVFLKASVVLAYAQKNSVEAAKALSSADIDKMTNEVLEEYRKIERKQSQMF